MRTTRNRLAASIVTGIGVLGLAAACGSGIPTASAPAYGGGAAASPPVSSQGNAVTATVAVMSVHGTKVLVGPTGLALYTNDQDTGGKPACVSQGCTAVWMPLTVPSGQAPTAAPGVGGTIAAVAVPGGKDQVTMNGKPLYTFALDGSLGQAHGNGLRDSFDGKHFSWHSAVPAGAAPPASAPPANNIPGY
jgi:predicted lipoprotein with Yx(FWY)xxD motif